MCISGLSCNAIVWEMGSLTMPRIQRDIKTTMRQTAGQRIMATEELKGNEADCRREDKKDIGHLPCFSE